MTDENLFERYDLDPCDGPRAITERLRELIEDATTDAERAVLRKAWEELTMHPARRLVAALGAHPETRPPLGAPPPRSALRIDDTELTLADVAVRPSVARALGSPAPAAAPLVSSTLDDDPILRTE